MKIKYLWLYFLLFIYIGIATFLSSAYPNLFQLIIHPLFFIFVSVGIYIQENISVRAPKDKEQVKRMVIIMLTYFIWYEGIGLVFGYVKNPYSFKIVTMIKNAWSFIIPIIGIEYVRSFLVNTNFKNKNAILLLTALIFLIELDLNTVFAHLGNNEKAFIFASSVFLPLLAYEMLYSYLSYKGSLKLVLIMRLIKIGMELYCPIRPDLDWFLTGVIGIVFPTIAYFVFKFYYDKRKRNEKRAKLRHTNPIVYLPIFIFIAGLTGFMFGIFNYMPISIASNSMNPIFYRGDAVVFRKVDNLSVKNIEIDDIIIYSKDRTIIVHRVIDKIEKEGQIYYKTKGDNNNAPDMDLVRISQVRGVYQFHIKYIGYPSIWLSDFLKKEKPTTVEIK